VGVALLVVLVGLGGWYGRELGSVRHRLAAERAVAAVKWDQAMVSYEKALAWSPHSWRAHIGLAHLLRTRSYWVRQPELKREWMDRARHHYERSLALNPWEADATYGLGTLYKLDGQAERALALRRQVVEQVPRHVFYLNELGIQLKDMGQYEEALQVFQESRGVEDSPVAARNIRWLQERIAAEAN
jgi:tetratricopeptide (TPR) repeat protein